jgi:hypothetical protein
MCKTLTGNTNIIIIIETGRILPVCIRWLLCTEEIGLNPKPNERGIIMGIPIAALLLFSEGTNHQKQALEYIAEATQTPYKEVVVHYLRTGFTDEAYDYFNSDSALDETAHNYSCD